jgi:hypothetical protein
MALGQQACWSLGRRTIRDFLMALGRLYSSRLERPGLSVAAVGEPVIRSGSAHAL